jgi:hypothetical protein
MQFYFFLPFFFGLRVYMCFLFRCHWCCKREKNYEEGRKLMVLESSEESSLPVLRTQDLGFFLSSARGCGPGANLGRWMITSNRFIIIINIHLTARHAPDERHDELQSRHMPPCPLRRERPAFR